MSEIGQYAKDLQAELLLVTHAAERHRDLAADRLKELMESQAECAALRHILAEASNTLFNGTKALQQFQPGSEAHRLQSAVDEAHRVLVRTVHLPAQETINKMRNLFSGAKALERAVRSDPERTWNSPWTQEEADAFGLIDEALASLETP